MTAHPSSQELADRALASLDVLYNYTSDSANPGGGRSDSRMDGIAAVRALAARLQAAEQALREIRDEVKPVMTHTGLTHTSRYGYDARGRLHRRRILLCP
jgi:YD repeat-containing protein